MPACKVTNDFAVVADCHHVVAKCPFSVPVELSAGSTVQLRVRLSLIHSLDDSLWCFWHLIAGNVTAVNSSNSTSQTTLVKKSPEKISYFTFWFASNSFVFVNLFKLITVKVPKHYTILVWKCTALSQSQLFSPTPIILYAAPIMLRYQSSIEDYRSWRGMYGGA